MTRKNVASGLVVLISLGIGYVGVMYLLGSRPTAGGFGLPGWEDADSFAYRIKGVRDVASGLGPLLLLALGYRRALGWLLLAAAVTPLGDAINVGVNGSLATALAVHGLAAAVVLVTAGLLLTERGSARDRVAVQAPVVEAADHLFDAKAQLRQA